jgi:hypothetical protein
MTLPGITIPQAILQGYDSTSSAKQDECPLRKTPVISAFRTLYLPWLKGAKQTSVNISTVVVRPLTLEALCKASGARGMAIAVHRQVVHLKYLADHVESIQHEYHGNK